MVSSIIRSGILDAEEEEKIGDLVSPVGHSVVTVYIVEPRCHVGSEGVQFHPGGEECEEYEETSSPEGSSWWSVLSQLNIASQTARTVGSPVRATRNISKIFSF